MAKVYPIEFQALVHVTDGDQRGTVTYTLAGGGKLPTEEDVAKAIEESVAALPDGFRLMTRHESLMHRLQARNPLMPNVALPKLDDGDEWHDPETATGYCNWGYDGGEDED